MPLLHCHLQADKTPALHLERIQRAYTIDQSVEATLPTSMKFTAFLGATTATNNAILAS